MEDHQDAAAPGHAGGDEPRLETGVLLIGKRGWHGIDCHEAATVLNDMPFTGAPSLGASGATPG
jgi:hypothetical protein